MHGSCVPAQVSNAAKATRHASVDGPTDSLLALQAVGGEALQDPSPRQAKAHEGQGGQGQGGDGNSLPRQAWNLEGVWG